MNYDPQWLETTPFNDYFWPAIILLFTNGVLCILAAALTHLRVKGHPWLVMFQGFVLAGWLTAELVWRIPLLWLQVAYLGIAFFMIWSGNQLRRSAMPR